MNTPLDSHLLKVLDLGLVDYQYAYKLQKNIVEEIKNKKEHDTIIFCQHYPVITLGRLAKEENILIDRFSLQNEGIKVYNVDRGGDTTLHNPGQLVVYPIFDLHRFKTDLAWFLDKIEEIIIQSLKKLSIQAKLIRGLRGVWVGNDKIASIGIGIKNWITYHGLSLNVFNDLNYFSFIRPCGLDVKMTSLKKNSHSSLSINEIKNIVLDKFIEVFNFRHPIIIESRMSDYNDLKGDYRD